MCPGRGLVKDSWVDHGGTGGPRVHLGPAVIRVRPSALGHLWGAGGGTAGVWRGAVKVSRLFSGVATPVCHWEWLGDVPSRVQRSHPVVMGGPIATVRLPRAYSSQSGWRSH